MSLTLAIILIKSETLLQVRNMQSEMALRNQKQWEGPDNPSSGSLYSIRPCRARFYRGKILPCKAGCYTPAVAILLRRRFHGCSLGEARPMTRAEGVSHWPQFGWVLRQCRSHWPNISPTLVEKLVSVGQGGLVSAGVVCRCPGRQLVLVTREIIGGPWARTLQYSTLCLVRGHHYPLLTLS